MVKDIYMYIDFEEAHLKSELKFEWELNIVK